MLAGAWTNEISRILKFCGFFSAASRKRAHEAHVNWTFVQAEKFHSIRANRDKLFFSFFHDTRKRGKEVRRKFAKRFWRALAEFFCALLHHEDALTRVAWANDFLRINKAIK